MERLLIIAFFLMLAIILISGCTQVKDCGSDTECFLEAAQTCAPARLTTSITSGEGDYILSMEVENRIGGLQGNDCIFSLLVKDLVVPQNLLSQLPDLAQDFNALKGSQMICRIPGNVEIKTFDELKEQVMNVYSERCIGTYKSVSERLYEKIFGKWEKTEPTNFIIQSRFCTGQNTANVIVKNVGKELLLDDIVITNISTNKPIENPNWTTVDGAQSITELKPGETGKFSTRCRGSCIYRFVYGGTSTTYAVHC